MNTGWPSTSGTQRVRVDRRLEAAPLSEPDTVDERRAEMGMEPFADELAYLREVTAQRRP